MMLDLDSAIQHCEEVASRCEAHCIRFPELLAYEEKFYDAKDRASKYRQLADWLKELKRYKEFFDSPEEAEECLNGYMV